jgi:hypothetical protein
MLILPPSAGITAKDSGTRSMAVFAAVLALKGGITGLVSALLVDMGSLPANSIFLDGAKGVNSFWKNGVSDDPPSV